MSDPAAQMQDAPWRRLPVGPYIVFDDSDETYLADEKWTEELYDADRFYDLASADIRAKQVGGRAESYHVHDRPDLIRRAFEFGIEHGSTREREAKL